MLCKKCGREIIPGKRFCGGCGAPVDQVSPQQYPARQAPPQPPVQPSPKQKNSGKIILAVIIPLVVVIAAVGILFATGVISLNKDGSSGKADSKEKSSEVGDSDDNKDNAGADDSNSAKGINEFETIKFGKYEQDNDTSNGKEDIEWLVLSKENGRALLISKYALDCRRYNEKQTDVTWETCTLRKWLNEDFYNTAFSSSEQSKIQTTTVTADNNPVYDTNSGNDTQDKVFFLSCTEAEKYFSSFEARRSAPTTYAKEQGARTTDYKTADGKAACGWWLRTPGYGSNSSCFVFSGGDVYDPGIIAYCDYYGIRPALYINL